MKYRAEIDGLRALAVVPVILFHAGFELFSGGFVGVDVFFVISGYLITLILVEDIENKRFSIIKFYERRARRILPALFFVMLCCIPFAWMWMLPGQLSDFAESLIAVSLFVSNILFWLDSGYFAAASEVKPLLHTWSLAVEEQYYVIFPIFLSLAWRFGKNRVFWMIVIFATASLILSEWGWRSKPSPNFYLLPTRAWEIFAGSIAAFIVQKRGIKNNNLLAILGFSAIVFSILFYDNKTPFPSLYALVPVLGVVLLILYADTETFAARLLSTRLFVGMGLISYSAYLWHQPLFAFAKIQQLEQPSDDLMLALSALSVLLAIGSWYFIERPFRNKSFLIRPKILSLSTASLCVAVLIGLILLNGNGFPDRFKAHSLFKRSVHWNELNNKTTACLEKFGGDQYCVVTQVDAVVTDLLIGDSHANHFFVGLSSILAERNRNLLMVGAGGCPPFIDIDMGYHYLFGVKLQCEERTNALYKRLLNDPHIKNVFLSFQQDYLFDPKLDFTDLREELDFSDDRKNAVAAAIIRTINLGVNAGKSVFLIEDLPDITFERFEYCLKRKNNAVECEIELGLHKKNALYELLLVELEKRGINVIRTWAALESFPYAGNSGDYLYRDITHLSEAGSLYVVKKALKKP